MSLTQKHSCAACARRKVKCNRSVPCSNCSRSRSKCTYGAPAPSQRHRKRPPDVDLLSKINEYEQLLRENNVKFQPLDNLWIPSPLEERLGPKPPMMYVDSSAQIQAASQSGRRTEAQSSEHVEAQGQQSEVVCLWFGLSKELRECSTEQLPQPKTEVEADATEANGENDIMATLLIPINIIGAPPLLELHPAPKHIFRLWRAFAEKIDPLTKVIHTPTLQQRIIETSWSLETVSGPLESVMFAVYGLAITSMRPLDCIQEFGETKLILLNRYRSGAARSLSAVGLHSTRDLEVLQAFVLFLLIDPRSEVSVTLVSIAMRIGHKMGLHRTGSDPRMPFFEQEMRIRVWWQIMGLESWSRRKVLHLTLSLADYGNVRMPLNVNDAELHPNMETPPVEHVGATEMLYCLMKYEVRHYIRAWLRKESIDTANPYELIQSTSRQSMGNKRTITTELSKIYENKYLCYCDPKIPLHRISVTMGRMTIHRLRFWFYHPRNQVECDRKMPQADADILFESSIRLLQLNYDFPTMNFSIHLLQNQALQQTEVDALVYMISELRQRVSGELVVTAWSLVERIYRVYPQLLRDDNKFSTALAEVTLEAWESYAGGVQNGERVPEYITELQERKRAARLEDIFATPRAGVAMPDGAFPPWWMDDDPLDWVYWNEPPQRYG